MSTTTMILLAAGAALLVLFALAMRRVPEGWRYTVERFGRYTRTLEPGLRLLLPLAERIGARQQVSERLIACEPFSVASVDLVPVRVQVGVCIQVVDAAKASYEVTDMAGTVAELLRAAVGGVIGSLSLDEILRRRDDLGAQVIDDLDASCSAWGVQVTRIDLVSLQPPEHLLQARTAALAAQEEKVAATARAEQDQAVAVAAAEQARLTAEAAAAQDSAVAAARAEEASAVAIAEAQQARDVAIAAAEQARETARIAAEQEREAAEHAVAQEHLGARRAAEELQELARLESDAERTRVVAAAAAEQERVELIAQATERRAAADARAVTQVASAIREGGAQAAAFQLAREYIDALRVAGTTAVPADGGPMAELLKPDALTRAAGAEAAATPAGVHELNTG